MSIHFTIAEMIRSQRAKELGIDNSLPESLTNNLAFLIAGAERVRALLGHAMIINSGYRCEALNKAVGGSKNSRHLLALAIDFTCPGYGDPQAVAEAIAPMRFILGIDQLILEHGWVHVSFSLTPRYQVLRYIGGGTYTEGLDRSVVPRGTISQSLRRLSEKSIAPAAMRQVHQVKL